jgi:peptide/nickel transport system permease protein
VLRYLLRRVPSLLLTALLASIAVFLLIRLAPGNPAVVLAGGAEATPEAIAAITRELGLDAPLPVQYWTWLHHLVTGDLGQSYIVRRSIGSLIGSRVESTLDLALAATLLMSVVGIALGIAGAAVQSARVRSAVDTVYAGLLSMPTYVTSIVLLVIFGVFWPVLPISGQALASNGFREVARYLALPSLALALPNSIVIARLLQTNLEETLAEEFIRAARARGVTPRRILWIHALKNSISTAVVAIGIRFGGLLGGAIVVEAMFGRTGLGQLAVSSVANRDYLVVQDLVLFAVVTAMLVQLLTELIIALADPRVRLQ